MSNLTKQKNNKYYSAESPQDKGFTLIETLVAIFILLIAVTGPMSAAQNSLKASFLARDQVTAFYLAQDAIEYIKNHRDIAALNSASFQDTPVYNDANNGGGTLNKVMIDTINNQIESCGVINGGNPFEEIDCNPMEIDSEGYFVIDGSSQSKFTRGVVIKQNDDNNDEFEIVVEVKWETNLYIYDRKIVVQENIYNWLAPTYEAE